MVDINNSFHAPDMHTSSRGFQACRQGGCLCDNENPGFFLFLYLTGAHFRGELQHIGDVSEQKIKC